MYSQAYKLRSSFTFTRLCFSAYSNAVSSFLSFILTSAPESTINFTILSWPAAAATISADMKFGLFDQGDLPDFLAVKAAFESTYACLGITCEHVGGLVDADGDPLHAMTAPCDGSGSGGAGSDRSGGSSSSGDSTGAIVGATIGGCAAGLLAGGYLLYRRRRAKLSDPVPVDMVVSSSDYSKAAPGRIGINSPHATGVTLSQEVDARV